MKDFGLLFNRLLGIDTQQNADLRRLLHAGQRQR
jgi:hypothetical protein